MKIKLSKSSSDAEFYQFMRKALDNLCPNASFPLLTALPKAIEELKHAIPESNNNRDKDVSKARKELRNLLLNR